MVSLKIFGKEEESESPLTAFKQKGIWYYKARAKDVRMTINAMRLNALFEEYLKQFEYDEKHKEKLAGIILERLKERLASKIEESTQLKKRISEIKGQLEGMEECYVLGSLSRELYENMH